MEWLIAGSATLGIVCGGMVGLSNSPVVAGALSLVSGLCGGVITLASRETKKSDAPRIGGTVFAFCVGLVLAMLLGITARINDWLSPTVADVKYEPRYGVALSFQPDYDDLAALVSKRDDGDAGSAVAAFMKMVAQDKSHKPIALTQEQFRQLTAGGGTASRALKEIFKDYAEPPPPPPKLPTEKATALKSDIIPDGK